MVIQTCSEVFAVLMQMEAHGSFSADAVNTFLNCSNDVATYSVQNFHDVPANDRTSLSYPKL